MPNELTEGRSLSLYEIESELAEIMAARDEAQDDAERAAGDTAIAAYVEAQVKQVDGIRAYIKHAEFMAAGAKTEAETQAKRAKTWMARADRLKSFALDVMQRFGIKRLEGRTGTLSVAGNGGRQPVTITDETMVPDEFCEYTGTLPAKVWRTLQSVNDEASDHLVRMTRSVRLAAISEALARPCTKCGGSTVGGFDPNAVCERCGGSSQEGVPGARLEARGFHLNVK